MFDQVTELLENDYIRASGVVLGSIFLALIAEYILTKIVGRLVGKTETQLDDEIIEALQRPVFVTFLLIGVWWAVLILGPSIRAQDATRATLFSIGILYWLFTAMKVTTKILRSMSKHAAATGRRTVIHPRTIPVFDMLLKVALVAAAIYFALIAWRIDPTAWLASAGILGIAIGFAAKDSLANLFAGIFIVADAPYKVGDMIVLDGSLRGRVTSIGIRSTRILTLDDIEITVPNSTMGNSMIQNEAGGPAPKQRISINVSAAYGSDIDQVHEVLLRCAEGVEMISEFPEPKTRFTEFGASGLDFKLLVWLDTPHHKDELINLLNNRVYKAFAAAGIEIPYSKLDVFIKENASPPPAAAR